MVRCLGVRWYLSVAKSAAISCLQVFIMGIRCGFWPPPDIYRGIKVCDLACADIYHDLVRILYQEQFFLHVHSELQRLE